MRLPLFSIFTALWLLTEQCRCNESFYDPVSVIPSAAYNGSTYAQFISGASGLDGPKIHPVNDTSFDWWYFDTVSEDQKTSVVVSFFTSTSDAFFALGDEPDVVSVDLWVSFPNGTIYTPFVNATEAVVVTVGDGTTGYWEGTGMSWTSTPDLSYYVVNVNAPNLGIYGSLVLQSIAPAHYPCGPAVADQTLQQMPHIGWANAVPDAIGTAEFSIGGSKLSFTGSGYHDKPQQNWSDRPFVASVGSWTWGHGRLGPYSLVWFDSLTPNGTEYVSAYASLSGTILTASCTLAGLSVRPFGANATYPPTPAGNPTGFNISMDLGAEGILDFAVEVVETLVQAPGGLYTRWTGALSGGIEGREALEGFALFEQFRLS
ncbi:MAG: hypothetical protein M1827_001604 [Pycnora praestabilis]|nr:MAG: hypothetical protein M1827_001604 [Pycnora praestabilis]